MGIRIIIWIIKGLSRLPLALLYPLSDLLYLVLFRIKAYRKRIVLANLKHAFPDKPPAEIEQIAKAFYRHFFDLVIETIRLISMGEHEVRSRVQLKGFSILRSYREQGRNIIGVLGHMANWELCASRLPLEENYPVVLVYKPLKNTLFDALLSDMRSKFGARLYRTHLVNDLMEREKEMPRGVALMADQRPAHDSVEWIRFFDRDTAAFTGAARYAKKYDNPIVYVSLKKTRRGHYDFIIEKLIEDPLAYTNNEIIQTFFSRLERDIREQPFAWLWTHRRWRRKGDQNTDIYSE